jgi:hypothetical protein
MFTHGLFHARDAAFLNNFLEGRLRNSVSVPIRTLEKLLLDSKDGGALLGGQDVGSGSRRWLTVTPALCMGEVYSLAIGLQI